MRDFIVKALDEIRDLETQITEMRDKADPEDSASHAKLDELLDGRRRDAKQLGDLAPRMLAGLLAALLIATIAEVACFVALATNSSTAATFYLSSVGTAVVAYSVAATELSIYKVSFGQRGLLLPTNPRTRSKG
jgi:hypothetical protein